jgi:putative effector of murein hydrolase
MTIDEVLPSLAADQSFGAVSTLSAYVFAVWLQRRCGGAVLLNPVLVSVVLLVSLLEAGHVPYADYMRGAGLVSVLLGPATVALAVPLYDNLASIRRMALAILPAMVLGSATTCLAAMAIGQILGASRPVVMSLATHSATTPVAMGIAEQIGGEAPLAAAFTLLTGLSGIMFYAPAMRLVRVRDWRARGLAIGISAHGLGTARLLQVNATAGAYGGMAIGVGAVLTAAVAPFLALFVTGF